MMTNKVLRSLNYIITIITALAYTVEIVALCIFRGYTEPIICVAVVSVGVFICSVLRILINKPRPYEADGSMENVFGKKTTGKSFPSRHVFSIFAIASAVFIYLRPIGAALMLLGVLLAYCRVKAKVHYVSDVICGALLGILTGIALFMMLHHLGCSLEPLL